MQLLILTKLEADVTVKELIEQLRTVNPDAVVMLYYYDYNAWRSLLPSESGNVAVHKQRAKAWSRVGEGGLAAVFLFHTEPGSD